MKRQHVAEELFRFGQGIRAQVEGRDLIHSTESDFLGPWNTNDAATINQNNFRINNEIDQLDNHIREHYVKGLEVEQKALQKEIDTFREGLTE